MSMAEIIKNLRLQNNLTQEELGQYLGVQKSAIRKYESGAVENIPRSSVLKMATLFGVKPSYIMGFEEEPQSNSTIFCSYKNDTNAVQELIEHLPAAQSPEAWELCNKIFRLDDTDVSKTDGFVEALLTADKYQKSDENKK